MQCYMVIHEIQCAYVSTLFTDIFCFDYFASDFSRVCIEPSPNVTQFAVAAVNGVKRRRRMKKKEIREKRKWGEKRLSKHIITTAIGLRVIGTVRKHKHKKTSFGTRRSDRVCIWRKIYCNFCDTSRKTLTLFVCDDKRFTYFNRTSDAFVYNLSRKYRLHRLEELRFGKNFT